MADPAAGEPRLAALKMLDAVLNHGRNVLEAEPANAIGDARDRAFSRHLAYGVLRWLTALQWLAGQLLKKPFRQKDRDVELLVLMGLFQLWKADTAAHAAIHESAECARKVGKPWAVAVINAVLRRFQREQSDWTARLGMQDERHAHPAWLMSALRNDWPGEWEAIVTANNRPGALWVRLNPAFDAQETECGLERGGFAIERHSSAPDALRIEPAAAVEALPGFGEGRFSVQDPAAQLAAGLLRPEAGNRILDACAAPGGKTCHILEREPGVALTAIDQSAARLSRVRENLDRLGFTDERQVRLTVANAAEPERWWDGIPFDRILLDAPCTATGVIRRHPEIKWLRSPGQVSEAVEAQKLLLERLWPLLKSGGILLYATCSVFRAENSGQVQRFAEKHPDAGLVKIVADWGRDVAYGRQILPGEQDMDGFFYAILQKNG